MLDRRTSHGALGRSDRCSGVGILCDFARIGLNVSKSFRNAAAYIDEFGVTGYGEAILSALYDRFYEKRAGVNTTPEPDNPEDGELHIDQVAYVPIPYSALISTLRKAGIGGETHLIDYGCGAGRVLITAARLGVASAIGIELQPALAERASRNLALIERTDPDRLRVVQADATGFPLPRETNMLFFFNPFVGQTLEAVVKKIETAVADHDQGLTIVYFNDADFRPLALSAGWRELARGVALSRTRWPLPWGIYSTEST